MCKLEHHQGSFSALLGACLLSFVYFLLVTPSVAEPVLTDKSNLQASETLIVSTNDGLVSIKATEAPLIKVLEKLGQELDIDVETHVTAEEKISIEFNDLSVEEALKQITRNYAVVSDQKDGKITKIVLFPIGQDSGRFAIGPRDEVLEGQEDMGAATEQPAHRAESSAPFEFSFDPSEFMEEEEQSE